MAVVKFRKPNRQQGQGLGGPNRSDDDYEEDLYLDDGSSDDGEDSTEEYEEAPRPDYAEKIRSHRLRIFLRTFLVVAIVIVVGILAVVMMNNRNYTQASFETVKEIQTLESATYLNLAGTVVSYSRDGANCMDTKGNALWNITYEMQQPIVDICEDVVAIGDYNGSIIYICNKEGPMGEVRTNMPIRSFCVAKNGEVAAVLDDTNVTWVYVFDVDGNQVAYSKTTMNQTGYPIAVSVSPNGELVCISHLMMDHTNVKSSVAFHNFGKVGQNYVDNCVSGFDYENEIVPYVRFMNNNTSFAVSDSRLVFYNGAEIPQNGTNNMFSENLQGVYYDSQFVALLFPDTTGENQYRLDIYNSSGSKVGSVGFTMDYTSIQIIEDRIVIHDDQNCQIFSTSGTKRFEGSFGKTVNAVIPSKSANKYTIVTENEVQTMTLK